jgi:transposase
MKTKTYKTIIGVDLGDKQHHVCVTDKDGKIVSETTIANNEEAIARLVNDHPGALVSIEVGTHSPWISRLIEAGGCACVVANARKLRAIYQNDRKCDQHDARMLAKLVRADPELLSPIRHGSEERQLHRLAITLRDSLVRQRVNIISTVRFSLKSLGIRLPGCSTASFAKQCREQLDGTPVFYAVEASVDVLDTLNIQIRTKRQAVTH